MAEDKKNQGNRSAQMPPPPPPLVTPEAGVKPDGTHEPEVGGHIDRSVPRAPDTSIAGQAKAALGMSRDKELAPEDDNGEPLPPDVGIEVIATRPGFFRQQRMVEGDRFQIPSMQAWGDWMRLADDKAEAKRVKEVADKKRAAAQKEKDEAGL